ERFNGAAEFTRRNAITATATVKGADGRQWSRRGHSAECRHRTLRAAVARARFNGAAEFTRRNAVLAHTEEALEVTLQWSRRVHSAECELRFGWDCCCCGRLQWSRRVHSAEC